MPRVNTQVARNNIYAQGKKVPDAKTKSGFRRDRSLPANSNDTIVIPKGRTYYKWSFRYGGTHISLIYPKPSQLTESPYLSTLYSIQEQMEEKDTITDADSLSEFIETIKSQLEELRDTTQESLDRMPEGLQEGDTGQLLQERIDGLEGAISELEEIDAEYEEPDEDEIKQELADDIDDDPEQEDDDVELTEERKLELVKEEDVQTKKDEHLQEWLDEKLDELSNVDLSF